MTQPTKAALGFPPSWHFLLGSRQLGRPQPAASQAVEPRHCWGCLLSPYRKLKLFPSIRVPWFPDHLHLDLIISGLHWVGCSPITGLSSNGSHRFCSAGSWSGSSCMSGMMLVAIVMGQLWGICSQGSRGWLASICLASNILSHKAGQVHR